MILHEFKLHRTRQCATLTKGGKDLDDSSKAASPYFMSSNA
jgi:hypothetical protein